MLVHNKNKSFQDCQDYYSYFTEKTKNFVNNICGCFPAKRQFFESSDEEESNQKSTDYDDENQNFNKKPIEIGAESQVKDSIAVEKNTNDINKTDDVNVKNQNIINKPIQNQAQSRVKDSKGLKNNILKKPPSTLQQSKQQDQQLTLKKSNCINNNNNNKKTTNINTNNNKRLRFSGTNQETVQAILERKRALQEKSLKEQEKLKLQQEQASKNDPRLFGKGFSPTAYSPEKPVMPQQYAVPKFNVNNSISTIISDKELFILALLSLDSSNENKSLRKQHHKFDEEKLMELIEQLFKRFNSNFKFDSNNKLKFDTFNQYKNVMTTMIILDTWAQINECLETMNYNNFGANNDILMMNQAYSLIEDKHFYNLCLKCSFSNADFLQDRHRQFDQWIVLITTKQLSPNHPNESNQFSAFGFIQDIQADYNRTKEFQIVRYSIKISKYLNNQNRIFPIKCEEFLVKPIYYLKPTIRLIETMKLLENRPFFQTIIQPNYDDFSYDHLERQLSTNAIESFKFHEPELYNAQQQLTIKASFNILQLPYAINKFLLVQGPPGTGKTHTIIGIIKNIFTNIRSDRKDKPLRILICAPSNGAIDEIGRRLINIRSFLRDYRGGKSLKMVRIGQMNQIHPEMSRYGLENLINLNIEKVANQQPNPNNMNSIRPEFNLKRSNLRDEILFNADIILSTLTSCQQSAMDMFRDESSKMAIRCLIVDEASQCIEPELLMPLIYHSITKVILIGDPLQLPATVISKKAQQLNFGRSLFERFFIHLNSLDRMKIRSSPIIKLNEQYRMHPEICHLPSKLFYESMLITHPNAMQMNPRIHISHPYFVFDIIDTVESQQYQNSTSKSNDSEVEFICKMFQQILLQIEYSTNNNSEPITIGIITFYRGQKYAIQEQFQKRFSKEMLKNVEVNTVDGFQGQERDIIILSCVRAFDFLNINGGNGNGGTGNGNGRSGGGVSIGFVRSQQRMNVALTRAKSVLCICLHAKSFENVSKWQQLLNDAQNRKRLFQVKSDIDYFEMNKILTNNNSTL